MTPVLATKNLLDFKGKVWTESISKEGHVGTQPNSPVGQ
jgi:hypothetical protein